MKLYEVIDKFRRNIELLSRIALTKYQQNSITAEEAMKKVRRGEKLTMEEHDSMTVEESMKFYSLLATEKRINPEVADATIKSLEVYLRLGIIKLEDTVKEAERKIDDYWRTAG